MRKASASFRYRGIRIRRISQGQCPASGSQVREIDVEPITVTIAEAVRVTGVSRTAIYQLIRDGRLETVKVRKRRLVKTRSLRRLFEGDENTVA